MMNHQTEALELDNDAMSFLGDTFSKKKLNRQTKF